MPICTICNVYFKNRCKVGETIINVGKRKQCLTCVPLGTSIKPNLDAIKEKRCPVCEKIKSIDNFYKRRNQSGYNCYCKQCIKAQTLNRQRIFKETCIKYKGEKCSICGYNKCSAALEFHHVDPSKKEFILARVHSITFNNRIKEELDKCILVCANCHREIHVNETRNKYIQNNEETK